MTIEIHRSALAAAASAARLLADSLASSAVVALPTGRTAERLYASVVEIHARERRRFDGARVFNLDELDGLERRDPRSFAAFLHRHLLAHVDLPPARVRLLDGAAHAWKIEAEAHERAIAGAGGLDLAIVGIGLNGHIAFNEPAASLPARTHRVKLTPATRRAYAWLLNGRPRSERVPTHALTMGMGTILQAGRVVLLATGPSKTAIVARAVEGPVTTRVPASMLQLHPNVLVVLDEDAAGGLEGRADRRSRRWRSGR